MKYFLSFVEEYWPGQRVKIMGRIEIYDKIKQYTRTEWRFFTNKSEEYYKFREKWDFKEVSGKDLVKLRRELKKFQDIPATVDISATA